MSYQKCYKKENSILFSGFKLPNVLFDDRRGIFYQVPIDKFRGENVKASYTKEEFERIFIDKV